MPRGRKTRGGKSRRKGRPNGRKSRGGRGTGIGTELLQPVLADHRPQRMTVERVRIPGFADRAIIRMRWQNQITVGFAASAVGQSVFYEITGAYQPGQYFSVTTTPSYWAKYAAAYSFYRVHTSRIVIQADVASQNPTNPQDMQLFMGPTLLANGSITTKQLAGNHPWVKSCAIGGTSNSTFQPQYLANQIRVPVLLGQTRSEFLGSDLNRAAVNALPGTLASWFVLIAPESTYTGNVNVYATLEYDVEFYNRLTLDDNTYLMRALALSDEKRPLVKPRPAPAIDELALEGKRLCSSSTPIGGLDFVDIEECEKTYQVVRRNAPLSLATSTARSTPISERKGSSKS